MKTWRVYNQSNTLLWEGIASNLGNALLNMMKSSEYPNPSSDNGITGVLVMDALEQGIYGIPYP